MRHRSKKSTLDRKAAPRRALLKNLAASLVLYEKIKTTEAKAKTMRPMVERLITIGKKGGLTAKRTLSAKIPDKNAVKKILEVYVPRYAERKGGYTRIIKLGYRKGDSAKIVQIEFVK